MGVIIGAVIGYALGSRTGPDAWTEFEDACRTIYTSEEVRDLGAGVRSIARALVEKRAELIPGILGGAEPLSRLRPVA